MIIQKNLLGFRNMQEKLEKDIVSQENLFSIFVDQAKPVLELEGGAEETGFD